jgi:hypothetical protein
MSWTAFVRFSLFVPGLLALVGTGACSDKELLSAPLPPDRPLLIELLTDRAGYQLANSANVTITNRTSEPVLFGGCDDALEHQVGARWVEVPRLTYPCPAVAIGLDPGSSITLPFDLRSAITPGTYQLRRPFWKLQGSYSDRSYRRSNEFYLAK